MQVEASKRLNKGRIEGGSANIKTAKILKIGNPQKFHPRKFERIRYLCVCVFMRFWCVHTLIQVSMSRSSMSIMLIQYNMCRNLHACHGWRYLTVILHSHAYFPYSTHTMHTVSILHMEYYHTP